MVLVPASVEVLAAVESPVLDVLVGAGTAPQTAIALLGVRAPGLPEILASLHQ